MKGKMPGSYHMIEKPECCYTCEFFVNGNSCDDNRGDLWCYIYLVSEEDGLDYLGKCDSYTADKN